MIYFDYPSDYFPNGTNGSYDVFIARLLNLTYPDYLRFARDRLGAELIGKNKCYITVLFNNNQTSQLFINILNNAVKYTKEGYIKLRIYKEDIKDDNNEIEILSCIEPLYFDTNSTFIKALDKAYRTVTNDYESKMAAIGGGTYAKSINNCIAFGGEFQGRDCHMHDANEFISIETFKRQIEIYVEAIKNLNEIA